MRGVALVPALELGEIMKKRFNLRHAVAAFAVIAAVGIVGLKCARAAKMVDLVLGGPQGTPTFTAFRNANFAMHVGGIEDSNGLPNGVNQPAYEYSIPTHYGKTKWLLDLEGEHVTVVPGTDYIDLSIPANRAAIVRAQKKWLAQIGTIRIHDDCIMEVYHGQEQYAADLVQEQVAAGFKVMINNGDPYTARERDLTTPWGRVNSYASVAFIQVAIDYTDNRFTLSRFAITCAVINSYVAWDKSVIVGVFDLGGNHAALAQQFFGSSVFSNPLVYKHYNVSYAPDVNVGLQIPGGKPVVEPPVPTTLPVGINVDMTPRGPLYAPADNWWNLEVTNAPVDPNSAAIVAFVKTLGNNGYLHPDFNKDYGISVTSVDAATPLVPVLFNRYPSESDKGAPGMPIGYPIPAAAKTNTAYFENHEPGGGNGDGHLILFDGKRFLYELAYCSWNGSNWVAGCGAVFDLSTNYRRPEGWTSTDAAGLAIAPGLIRGDEVFGTKPITHALRFSVHRTNGKVWPASHSGASDAGAPPLGFRIRLKASKDISGYRPEIRKVLQALKTYGGICADRGGSSVNFQGTQDARFDPTYWNPAFHGLHIDDFEVVKLGWNP